jgi:hypothetical protein
MRPDDEEPRLPFPTKPLVIHGREIEEYLIPDDKRAEVLAQMYPFAPVPGLDEEWCDIHSGKVFAIRQFRVTREDGHNWLVSPYYEEGGGTVIDWLPTDEDDEGWIEDEEWDEDEGPDADDGGANLN